MKRCVMDEFKRENIQLYTSLDTNVSFVCKKDKERRKEKNLAKRYSRHRLKQKDNMGLADFQGMRNKGV